MSIFYRLIKGLPTKLGDIAVIRHNNCLLPIDLKAMNRLHMCMEFDGDGIMTLRKVSNKRNLNLT